MELGQRLAAIHEEMARCCRACDRDPDTVELLPISKKHPMTLIRQIYELGVRRLGENRVGELVEKANESTNLDGLAWQMVGSLQTNKVKQLLTVENLSLIQSLDRVGLANALQRALDPERTMPVLLQVNATGESNKHGVLPEDALPLLQHTLGDCPNLMPIGLMAMGPLGTDPAPCFQRVADLRDRLQDSTGRELAVLSMGMTDDMSAAIEAGSTMVRVGTGVFGPRPLPGTG